MRPIITAIAIATAGLASWPAQAQQQDYEYGDYFGRHDFSTGLPSGPPQVGREGPTPPNPFGPMYYAPQTQAMPQYNYGYQPYAQPLTYPTYPVNNTPYPYPQYGPAPVQTWQHPQHYPQRPIPVPPQAPRVYPPATAPMTPPALHTPLPRQAAPAPVNTTPTPPAPVKTAPAAAAPVITAPPAAAPVAPTAPPPMQPAPAKINDPDLPDVPLPPDQAQTSNVRSTSRERQLAPVSDAPSTPFLDARPAVPGHLPRSIPGQEW